MNPSCIHSKKSPATLSTTLIQSLIPSFILKNIIEIIGTKITYNAVINPAFDALDSFIPICCIALAIKRKNPEHSEAMINVFL